MSIKLQCSPTDPQLPPLQLCFAVMAISSHPALEAIPPLVYSTLRIAIALPLLLLSARLQVCTARLALHRCADSCMQHEDQACQTVQQQDAPAQVFDDHGASCNPALARRSQPVCAAVTFYITTI
jgi:hypothetical protein